jgi:hypothetical protein
MTCTKWMAAERCRSRYPVLGPLVLYNMALLSSKSDRSERSLELRSLETGSGGDDDQWLYLPALRRSRRIGSSNKSNSFEGSELAYEDLAPNEVTKQQYKYLREETLDGVPIWVIESTPPARTRDTHA